ncbi:proteasome assembly chaperone family protein [Natronosalvus vescus]|uniref:proteasome assembly chaperone family protein n=1 Tax=Natronosalvus vescus TaxID=2953881 RepID=UPI002091D403|nr:PAC2 family protein [Natronosalvus vescus]
MALEGTPSFTVQTRVDATPGRTLLLGTVDIGAAGLTTVDYLLEHRETTPLGRVESRGLPDVVPIADGVPRHPIRLERIVDTDLSVLISERFIPVWAAETFAAAVLEWARSASVEEIGIVHGAPYPHREEEHRVYYSGSPDFRSAHFEGEHASTVDPLPGGVLDGVNAELLVRSLEDDPPAVGVLTTPTHPPGADFDATLRLLEAVSELYGVGVDERELRRQSEEMQQYYQTLADRLQELQQEEQSLHSRDFPNDRMYM